MNWKMTLTMIALLLGGFLLMNSSNGRATVGDEGNTGAPGDEAVNNRTCQTCHNTGPLQVTLDIFVTDQGENPVDTYVPGETYNVDVVVTPSVGTPAKYGFQLVGEIDANNESTNSFSNASSNAKLVNTSNGRQYAEHKTPSDANQFSVEWTAPQAGTGDVTFYAGGNGVNGNGQNSGDGAAVTSFTLTEDVGASVFENVNTIALSVAPNPAYESIQLTTGTELNGNYLLRVVDMEGRIVLQQTGFAFLAQTTIAVDGLASGSYFVQILNGNNVASAKFLKR